MSSSIPKSYLKLPLHNGVGRHVAQLQRLVIRFCKSHMSSRGIRDFIESKLLDFTNANPGVVIYVKPRRWNGACLTATYLNGNTKTISVSGMATEEICQWMTHLKDISGFETHRLIHRWHTDTPSIQGVWTPYVNKDPKMNIIQYPSNLPEFRSAPKEPSATELILERARLLQLQGKEEGTPIN